MATFQGPGIRVLKQYQGQDGKTYVQLDTGETLATDSLDYEDYYAQGLLYGEDERGNFYPQEGAHDLLKQYQQLTQANSFENYMKPYFEDEMTGSIARGLGQSMDKFWEVNPSYKQAYDEQIKQQLVSQYLGQNPKNDGEERGAYFDRLTRSFPNEITDYIMDSGNPGVEPGYWADFRRGLYTTVGDQLGGGNAQLIRSIEQDPNLTIRERNQKIFAIERGEYGNGERAMDKLGILAPLAVPGKMVQAAYKDDYTLDDALAGNKNNAGVAEDILTDPLTYAGVGIAKNISRIPQAAEVVEAVNRFGSTHLQDAYKFNPFAFRTNPEAFYRQIDEAGLRQIEDAMGLIRGKGNEGAASYSKGELYYGSQDRPNILLEARKPDGAFNPVDDLLSDSENVALSNRPLDLLDSDINTYQRDWLQGYKRLDKPKTLEGDLPGGMKMYRDKNKTSILNPMNQVTDEGEVIPYNEEIALKKYFQPGDKEPFYNFYADMPSSPLKAGKAYKMLDDFIPIGGRIKEKSSLSWDSFQNVLKQSQQDKFNAYQDGFINMNAMSKNTDRTQTIYRNQDEFNRDFDELNQLIEQYGFDRAKLVTQPDPLFPELAPKNRVNFPNIVLQKKYEQGGIVLPDWLFE